MRLDAGQAALSPQLLPGGDGIVFTLGSRSPAGTINELPGRIVVQSLDSGHRDTLVSTENAVAADGVSDAQYLPSGQLVFAISGSLYGIAFDPKARKTRGDRVQIQPGAFQSDREGDRGIFWQRADGTGIAERLTTAPKDVEHIPESISPDGKHLLYAERKNQVYQLHVLSINDKKSTAFGNVKSNIPTGAAFSPNGRWVVYASTSRELGLYSRDNGIFIQPFPATGDRFQLPKVRIDYHPAWTPDGNSVIFVASSPEPFAQVDVHTQQGVTFGKPVALPQTVSRPGLLNGDFRGFDIVRDGRIVSLTAGDLDPGRGREQPEIRVVQNWLQELKARVPAQ